MTSRLLRWGGRNLVRLGRSRPRCYSSLTPGSEVLGFQVLSITPIDELQITSIRLRHSKTGCEYLHLERDDANNVFAVGFRTAVNDSTGVPHILEHTVLCGSQKYPIRDPFFKMLNRSLATYMNAWTAADYTLYPFSTENRTDYFNLMDVYLDATFHPKLSKLDFNQEGWRLERDDPNNLNSPISFKGVVYNEMKGAMSDVGSQFTETLQKHLYKGSTYEHNSGGDPKNITDLTYKQLRDFHAKHYHPSNAKIFSYGNFPLSDSLAFIDERIKHFERLVDVPQAHDKTPRAIATQTIHAHCAPDPAGDPLKQMKLTISFLANDVADTYETFCMKILTSLLLNGPSSPLRQALIESGLGTEYAPQVGYDSSMRETSISFGVQGAQPKDATKIEQTIHHVLQRVQKEGFEQHRIDAVLHQIELGLKHKTANFGLGLLQFVSSSWFQGAKCENILKINDCIARFRSESYTILPKLMEKHILKNPHSVTLIMEPKADYQESITQEETERLQRATHALTDEQKAAIAQETIALTKARAQTEDLSCLPSLTLNDIPREGRYYPTSQGNVADVPVQWRTTGTNNISYLRGITYIELLPDALVPYLPLFCAALTHQGTSTASMADLHEQMQLYTGGISINPLVIPNNSDLMRTKLAISFGSNAMDRNVDAVYRLLNTLINETNFDDIDRLKVLINNIASGFVNSLADSGDAFARTLAASKISKVSYTNELWGGTTQLQLMSSLVQASDLADVVEKLKSISTLLSTSSLKLAVVCEEATRSTHETLINNFAQRFPQSNMPLMNISTGNSVDIGQMARRSFVPHYGRVFVPTPFSVNFAATSIIGVPYTHPDSIKLQVLARLLTTHFLHKVIREENGAYGGGASYNGMNGVFSFYSYRDPQSIKTIDTFKRSLRWFCEGDRKVSERELMEAKLNIFGHLDSPDDVSNQGATLFTYRITQEMRQRRRDQLFAVSYEEVLEAARQHLLSKPSSSAIIGDERQQQGLTNDWTISDLIGGDIP